MPRIYTSQSDALDFCVQCFPMRESEAFAEYGDRGDGPDGRGNCFSWNDEHPDYGGDDYRCHGCGCRLSENRDGAAEHHPFKRPIYDGGEPRP